jgi:hypothetical protein
VNVFFEAPRAFIVPEKFFNPQLFGGPSAELSYRPGLIDGSSPVTEGPSIMAMSDLEAPKS